MHGARLIIRGRLQSGRNDSPAARLASRKRLCCGGASNHAWRAASRSNGTRTGLLLVPVSRVWQVLGRACALSWCVLQKLQYTAPAGMPWSMHAPTHRAKSAIGDRHAHVRTTPYFMHVLVVRINLEDRASPCISDVRIACPACIVQAPLISSVAASLVGVLVALRWKVFANSRGFATSCRCSTSD